MSYHLALEDAVWPKQVGSSVVEPLSGRVRLRRRGLLLELGTGDVRALAAAAADPTSEVLTEAAQEADRQDRELSDLMGAGS